MLEAFGENKPIPCTFFNKYHYMSYKKVTEDLYIKVSNFFCHSHRKSWKKQPYIEKLQKIVKHSSKRLKKLTTLVALKNTMSILKNDSEDWTI